MSGTGSLAVESEMVGLPQAIQQALAAHPEWKRVDRGSVVCTGPGCDWQKPGGKSTKQAWVRHQTWTLYNAIKSWYFDGETP